MKKGRLLILLLAMLLGMAGCAEKELPKLSKVGFYLDTVITLTAYAPDEHALEAAMDEIGRYEALLSRTREGSDVWRINHAEGRPVTVSDETVEVIRLADEISDASAGAFDITIAPASMLWDFHAEKPQIPDADALAAAAQRIGWQRLQLEGNQVTLPKGMMIDLGGIAKGYIADRIKGFLEEKGIRSAILSFGGNIVAIGTKPDGSPWKVGIQDIDAPTGASMLTTVNRGGSTVTSGIYERGFEQDGVYYHHLLSPRTGWPVQNDLASVTVFSDSSALGDALATAAFVLGEEAGMHLIEKTEGAEGLMIRKDRTMIWSSGAGSFR